MSYLAVLSHSILFNFDYIDLIAGEYFYASPVMSCLRSFFYSGLVALTGCKLFPSLSSSVSSYTGACSLCASCLDSEWVIPCQAQPHVLQLFLPLLPCYLDRKWVILYQVQLVPSHSLCFCDCVISLIGSEWFHPDIVVASVIILSLWFSSLDRLWVVLC